MRIDFENTELAFKDWSNHELRVADLVFTMARYPSIIEGLSRIYQRSRAFIPGAKWMVKRTVFRQFCGGESLEECRRVISKLEKRGIGTCCHFSAEDRERTPEGLLEIESQTIASIEHLKRADSPAQKRPAFTALKPSALISSGILARIQAKLSLNDSEEKEWQDFHGRIDRIASKVGELGGRLLIDAEESWTQDPIDDVCRGLMARYNKDHPVVYTTAQMYRKDRLAYLDAELDAGKRLGYQVGVKLVRGAYLEKETLRAAQLGYVNPLCASKHDTDANFDRGLELLLREHAHCAVFVATHNQKSLEKAMSLIDASADQQPDVVFSQLLGMGDNLTATLASMGYIAYKYVPYGPLSEVIPYLVRRLQENRSMTGQMSRELLIVREERKRRKQGSD